MNRKLSLIEGTMYAGGRTPVNVVSAVKIKGNIELQCLQEALGKVQARHPLLRVNVIEDDSNIPHFITQEPLGKVEVRIATRYTDKDWQKEAARECLKPFDAQHELLIRVVWLAADDVSELIFVCHHCICDGRSVLNIIDETLRLLAEPLLDIGSYTSFGSVQEFIPEKMRNSKLNQFKTALVSVIAKLALSLVAFKKEIKRNRPYLLYWKLDIEQSARILAKCKAEEVSVNAAISVAFESAFKSTGSSKFHDKMYCAVDMRKFIPQVAANMIFAYPSMIDLSLKKCKSNDFWSQARFIKEDLQEKINKMDVSGVLMYSESLMPSLAKMTKYARAEKGVHDFTLSNMGRVDIEERYGNMEVDAVYPHATIFPFGNPSTLFTTSFKGQIDFIFTSDEVFLAYDEAVLLKNEAMRLLIESAG
ncbi:MAG TPA: condensation domain-containing protein [Pedobacter sp.]|uniref:condensation domain-containing protein n=1 Tax=Pedobacter sp. TaxID=1411316 RepID=UPI002B51957B|nr:condensation domain-containing protein [Pedobacter sp.]HMI04201.1 condensation domain-containing protein [Pedobacter sp.]